MAAARDKLGQTLQRVEELGDCWPDPSPLKAVQSGGADGRTAIWVDVTVEDTPTRVTISLGERLLARIDAAAERRSMSRSGYLASAARRQLDDELGSPGASPSEAIMSEVVAAGRKLQETFGPHSPVGRTLSNLDAIALDGLRRIAGGVNDAMTKRASTSSDNQSKQPDA